MLRLKVYYGHIRNHKELCEQLGIDKALPRAAREEAIILAAYEKWGEDCANHFHGMFAFVIENGDGSLFLCRDHFGTVPLYYYETADGRLLAATTIRELMEQEGFEKSLNLKMLQIYLTMTYTTGDETFFTGVRKLLPGRFMTYKNGKKEITRYWRPQFAPDENKSLEEWADEIHLALSAVMTEVKSEDEYVESF